MKGGKFLFLWRGVQVLSGFGCVYFRGAWKDWVLDVIRHKKRKRKQSM